MHIRTGLFLIAVATALIASPVSAQTNVNQSNCVRNSQINNWKAFSDKLVMIESYTHRKVLLRLIGTCQNLAFKNSIAIKSSVGMGLSCVSVGDQVISRGFGSSGRCSIVGVEPYTPGLEKKYMKPRRN
jgi:transcription elongation GreA/GreB family factor